MKNTVIVTGATGFLGKRTALYLKSLGYEVYALGRKTQLSTFFERNGIRFISGDLSCSDVLDRLPIAAYDFVHCAGFSSPWGKKKEFHDSNIVATQNCINFALSRNVRRFIHISSPSIYFDFKNREQLTESSYIPKNQVNFYSNSKLISEKKVLYSFKTQGLPSIVLRPKAIVGAGDAAIMPRILRSLKKGKLLLINQGRAMVDVTHVDNVVLAIQLALEAPKRLEGESFNITNGVSHSITSLLSKVLKALNVGYQFRHIPYPIAYMKASVDESLARLTGIEPVLTRYSLGIVSYSQTFNIQKAKKQLGYAPRASVEDAISEYVNSSQS